MKLKKRLPGLAEIKARRERGPSKTMEQIMAELYPEREQLETNVGPFIMDAPFPERQTEAVLAAATLAATINASKHAPIFVGLSDKYAYRDGESPLDAFNRGVGYRGPEMPDKGKKDGSCNRSACQLPLAGKEQWYMKDHMVLNGLLYYCADCAAKFHEADRQFNEPFRCTLEE